MSKIWRHKKTGGLYIILHHAKMQVGSWFQKGWDDVYQTDTFSKSADMEDVIVYQSLQDDMIWTRPKDEFHERFENLNSAEYIGEGKVVLSHSDAF